MINNFGNAVASRNTQMHSKDNQDKTKGILARKFTTAINDFKEL